MSRYLLKQFLLSLFKLFLFASLMFFLIQIIMPGDFVAQFVFFLNAAEREVLSAQLGLDQSLPVRYVNWLGNLLQGDLGFSGFGFPVGRFILFSLPPTLLVFLPGTLIAFGIGLTLGKRTIWRGRGILTGATTFSGIALLSSFPPWLAWLVAYLFGRQASVSRGRGGINSLAFPDIDRMLWVGFELRPREVANRMVLHLAIAAVSVILLSLIVRRFSRRRIPVWLQIIGMAGISLGIWHSQRLLPWVMDLLESAALPLLTYVLLIFGETMIIMQSSMQETMKEEYMVTARAKGLSDRVLRDKHAGRNALLPVLSRFFISLPYLLGGIVIIEDSVNWPGMGAAMFGSLYWQDMPVVMGFLLFIGSLSLMIRLLLDVLAAYMDPRIRFDESSRLPIN